MRSSRTIWLTAVDAITLSGGSAFGIDAAAGVQAALREMGRGFEILGFRVPIVPGAILFDLPNGGDKDWGRFSPYRDFGFSAAMAASQDFEIGTAGAGTGATTATLKGGLGSASTVLENGITVGALVAVNAVGSVTIGNTPHFWGRSLRDRRRVRRPWPAASPSGECFECHHQNAPRRARQHHYRRDRHRCKA